MLLITKNIQLLLIQKNNVPVSNENPALEDTRPQAQQKKLAQVSHLELLMPK